MKRFVIVFLIVISLTSCNNGSGINNNIQIHNVNFDEKDIFGTWKLDKNSYKYLHGKESLDSIYITFNEDGTFKLNNSENLFKQKQGIPELDSITKNGIIDNEISKGKWQVTKYENMSNNLNLVYDNNINQSGLNVYKKGDEYQIWYFFGDPDSGERLRFLKNN